MTILWGVLAALGIILGSIPLWVVMYLGMTWLGSMLTR